MDEQSFRRDFQRNFGENFWQFLNFIMHLAKILKRANFESTFDQHFSLSRCMETSVLITLRIFKLIFTIQCIYSSGILQILVFLFYQNNYKKRLELTWCWNLVGSRDRTGTTLPYTWSSRTIEHCSLFNSGRNTSPEHFRSRRSPTKMSCAGSSYERKVSQPGKKINRNQTLS